MWGQSEWFYASTIFIWVSTTPFVLGPAIFKSSLFLFFLLPLIIFIGRMVHVHTIKFSFILYLRHHHKSWTYLLILSFDLLMHQDSRLPSHSKLLLFVSLTLFLVRVWVPLPTHIWTISRTEVLYFSNLDRRFVSARIFNPWGLS